MRKPPNYERLQTEELRETNLILVVNTVLTGFGALAGLIGSAIAIYLLL